MENEHVVLKALSSPIACQRGWRILKRDEQVPGARQWPLRGDPHACRDISIGEEGQAGTSDDIRAVIAEACIRCEKGTREGTQGFFVAGFVRDRRLVGRDGADEGKLGSNFATEARPSTMRDSVKTEDKNISDSEWDGFSDG